MLGPIPEALGDTCYVRSISGDFVMLGPIMEKIVILGQFWPKKFKDSPNKILG